MLLCSGLWGILSMSMIDNKIAALATCFIGGALIGYYFSRIELLK